MLSENICKLLKRYGAEENEAIKCSSRRNPALI
jgi:hypothetical protein